MKANTAFKNNEDAVSPVIGVILMVAITVVLAAVVFVLVSDLGNGSEKAPDMSFTDDQSADRLQLIRGDSGQDWGDYTISLQAAATGGDVICFGLNQEATDAAAGTCTNDIVGPEEGGALSTTPLAVGRDAAPAAVTGGDYIDFCSTTAVTASEAVDITVVISHTATNTLILSQHFVQVQACA